MNTGKMFTENTLFEGKLKVQKEMVILTLHVKTEG